MPKTTPPLLEICMAIKKMMKKYSPPLVEKSDFESRYELWTDKPVVIAGRKREEVYFGGVIIQSSYVGFYFMGSYIDPSIKKKTGAELQATLKGKSCHHIKTLDPKLMKQIKEALELGFAYYKKQGWV